VIGTVVGYVVFPYVLDMLIDPYCRSQAVLRPEGTAT
jgi:hypothetical protein